MMRDIVSGWVGIHLSISLKSIRRRTHEILDVGLPNDKANRVFDHCIVNLILLNVAAFAAETVDEVYAQYGEELVLFNVISVIIFTVEYLLRIWSVVETPAMLGHSRWRTRLYHATRPMQIIDLVVILPFYLSFFIVLDMRVLLRVLCLLRLFKLVRYSPILHSFGRVLYQERRAFFCALLVMMWLLLISAPGMYFLAHDVQPDGFGSVPESLWWSVATSTTAGSGDVTPLTPIGKLFGGIVILFGLGMIAFPIGIMATAFSNEANRRDLAVIWSMVAEVPSFSRLNAVAIADIIPLLGARFYRRGSVIERRGERAQGMFFITSGEVVVDTTEGPIVLKTGNFFSEQVLIRNKRLESTVYARGNCQLLMLDGIDFERLSKDRPEIGQSAREAAEVRRIESSRHKKEKATGNLAISR